MALRAQRLRSGDRVGCNVFFIWEMLRPLLRGATTVVIPDDVIYDPGALIRFMEEYGISETLITPSLLETVLDASGPDLAERLSSLRVLWLNGEVVTRTLARRALSLLPETRVLNVYSCSETHEVAAGDLRELAESPHSTYCPVGRPMDPDRLYILDDEVSKVPEGGTGELFVGGDCLARGYVNLPEKTEESFPADPFSPVDGARMYRTGDRARILPDGNLEILGRTDFMVKIRGYSVELGAVEAAIEDNLAVRACVVVADGEEGADKRLVAYLVPASEDERGERYAGWNLDPKTGRSSEIRRHLQDSLPHYAIPATFVEVEALPLHDVSGKVDRQRLPEPPSALPTPPSRMRRSASSPRTRPGPRRISSRGPGRTSFAWSGARWGATTTSSTSAGTPSSRRSSRTASRRLSACTSRWAPSSKTQRSRGYATGSRLSSATETKGRRGRTCAPRRSLTRT